MTEWAYYNQFSAEEVEQIPAGLAKKLILGNFARQCIDDERWDGSPIRFVWNQSYLDGSVFAGAAFEFEEKK